MFSGFVRFNSQFWIPWYSPKEAVPFKLASLCLLCTIFIFKTYLSSPWLNVINIFVRKTSGHPKRMFFSGVHYFTAAVNSPFINPPRLSYLSNFQPRTILCCSNFCLTISRGFPFVVDQSRLIYLWCWTEGDRKQQALDSASSTDGASLSGKFRIQWDQLSGNTDQPISQCSQKETCCPSTDIKRSSQWAKRPNKKG